MPNRDYIITHGSIRQDNKNKLVGEFITLDEAQAQLMDPDGTCLKLKAVHEAEQLGEAAKQGALKKAQAAYEKAMAEALAEKPAEKSKGGGK